MKNNKNIIIISLALLSVFAVNLALFNKAQAVSATLTGEITNDGGDPNLIVWFQYGKTTSYNYETPQQSKIGVGEFTATVSNLDLCTIYHYRAVAKHRDFNDTTYGEDKTFATACNVVVDLKANGSDGPISIPYSERNNLTLSWTSSNADVCIASGAWSGTKTTSGSEKISLSEVKTYTFSLLCKNSVTGFQSSDSVSVTLLAPGAPTVITKGVVVTY